VFFGGLIGLEREFRDKAAGFRTLIFICLGATLFTILSTELAGDKDPTRIAGVPLTRHWLIPQHLRPKLYTAHPVLALDEIKARTQKVWDRFYSLRSVWKRLLYHAALGSRSC
jgi:hypothetical protein